jgi:hypothetical protein
VTREDVAKAAKAVLKPDKLVTLVVGKAADFDRPIASLGDVKEIDISIAAPSSDTVEIVRSPENLQKGKTIAEKLVARMGVVSMESYDATFDISMDFNGQQVALKQQVVIAPPNKMFQKFNTPFGEQVIVVNGDEAIMKAGGQTNALPGNVREQMMKDLGHDLFLIGAMAAASGEPVAVGQDAENGCEMIAVTLMGAESRLCVDANGNIVRQIYQGRHPMQQTPGTLELAFSEFTDMDGAQVPKSRVMFFDGQEIAKMTLESFSINGATPETFSTE